MPQVMSPALCLAGEKLGIPACTKGPKGILASPFSGVDRQGRGHSNTSAGGWLSWGGQEMSPEPKHPHTAFLSAPCPLAAKQDPALDAPCLMGTGLMPSPPVSPVSNRPCLRLGSVPPARSELAVSWLQGRDREGAVRDLGLCGVALCCVGLERQQGKQRTCGWVRGAQESSACFFLQQKQDRGGNHLPCMTPFLARLPWANGAGAASAPMVGWDFTHPFPVPLQEFGCQCWGTN